MQPNWQQRMQQQQQQQRQRMAMGAAWQQEQERKQRQQAAAQAADADSLDPYARVEALTLELRRAFEVGRLSEKDLQARLDELMVQDGNGTWWAVGIQSMAWQRFDGRRWVPGTPPGRASAALYSAAPVSAVPAPAAPAPAVPAPAAQAAKPQKASSQAAPRPRSMPAMLFYSLFYGAWFGFALFMLFAIFFPSVGEDAFGTVAILFGIVVAVVAFRHFRAQKQQEP
jgi:hypothetical protein